jgi:hypothetical protein
MPADIIKGAYLSTPRSDDDKAFAADLLHKVIAGVRNLLRPTDTQPTLIKNALRFFSENLLRGVILSWQSAVHFSH